VLAQFSGILSCSPGATGQFRDTFSDGEVSALNVGGVYVAAEPGCFEEGAIDLLRAPNEPLFDVNNTGSMPMFDDLGIVEGSGDHPGQFLFTFNFYPLAEMSGKRVEVVLQAIRAEDRDTTWLEPSLEFMDDRVGSFLSTRSELDDGDNLGLGIANGPDPDLLPGMLDVSPELIELDVDELELGEEEIVEFTAVITASGEPGADGGFADTIDFFDGGSIDTKSEEVEHLADDIWIRLEAIEGRVTADGELPRVAGLALQVLNGPKDSNVFPSSDDGVDIGIRNAEVSTGRVGAEVPFGCDGFLWAAFAFDLIPGDDDMRAIGGQRDIRSSGQTAVRAVLLGFGPEHDGRAGSFLTRLTEKPISDAFIPEQTEEFEG